MPRLPLNIPFTLFCGSKCKGLLWVISGQPWGHWNTTTVIAALRVDRIDAPWLLDGSINSEAVSPT